MAPATLESVVLALVVIKRAVHRRASMKKELKSISHLHGLPHLYEMERLISTRAVPLRMLTPEDLGLLNAIEPVMMPQTILNEMVLHNRYSTMALRVAAVVKKEQNPTARVIEIRGNLLRAPVGSVLIHACNTVGQWGAGIANQFQAKYPEAYEVYSGYCKLAKCETGDVFGPLGKCLVIPPQEGDIRRNHTYHWIACLFTKVYPGRAHMGDFVMRNTEKALVHMHKQVEFYRNTYGENGVFPGQYWACRFNSGNFAVPWSESRAVLARIIPETIVVSPDCVN